MFIYELFNLLWHIREGKKGLSHLLRQTDNFWGGEGKAKVLEKPLEGRERGLSSVYFLCPGLQPHRTIHHA